MATPFQTYTVHYFSGGIVQAQIQIFASGQFIGNITFHKDSASLPPNTLSNGVHNLNYTISRFRDVLQILQYEKPLHVNINNGIADLMAAGFRWAWQRSSSW